MAAPATQCLVRSWRLRFDETGSDRVAGELGTVSQSQRLKDVGAVALDGLETDGQQTEQREVPASCLKTIGQALKSATRTLHCTSASFVGDANATSDSENSMSIAVAAPGAYRAAFVRHSAQKKCARQLLRLLMRLLVFGSVTPPSTG